MSERYTNIARGNSRVGTQIGKAVGDVIVGSAQSLESDFRIQLSELRSAMRRSVGSGGLKAIVHESAEAELREVDSYLERGGAERREKMLLALKRVKILLSDVADLASIAAIVLTIGQGLT
jgi:adenosylhomocysteine nucleosidase